jgi:hypothetical protein
MPEASSWPGVTPDKIYVFTLCAAAPNGVLRSHQVVAIPGVRADSAVVWTVQWLDNWRACSSEVLDKLISEAFNAGVGIHVLDRAEFLSRFTHEEPKVG